MSKREHRYWHQALLKAFGDAKDNTAEEWFFFHWFWANHGTDTIYL
jgi:hypothetical protein